MKYFGIFQLIAIFLTLSACTSLDPVVSTAGNGSPARVPALYSQDTLSMANFSRTNVYCENADKLAGQQAHILRVGIAVSFANESRPQLFKIAMDMKNRAAVARDVACSSGLVESGKDAFMVSCGKDNNPAWALSLVQAESVYAKQNSVFFFTGNLSVPGTEVAEDLKGAANLRINCIARPQVAVTEADIKYLKDIRFMFGHIERE